MPKYFPRINFYFRILFPRVHFIIDIYYVFVSKYFYRLVLSMSTEIICVLVHYKKYKILGTPSQLNSWHFALAFFHYLIKFYTVE